MPTAKPAARGDLVERLWSLAQAHAPARVLVWVSDPISARWLSNLLIERGPVVGLRILDTEALLAAAMTELVGEPLSPASTLALVRAALLDDPDQRFAAIAEHPSYLREVLRTFTELERGLLDSGSLAPVVSAAAPRDRAMLDAFTRFRAALADHRGWWRGQAPRVVLEGHRRVAFLRRRVASVAVGFRTPTSATWERRLIEGLGFERWTDGLDARLDQPESAQAAVQVPLRERLSCAGPEAEIAEVARLLRRDAGAPAVVLAPPEEIPRWVARLRHRDVPVRAWVERRAATTAAAGTVRALLRILAEPRAVRRADLEQVLFGTALRVFLPSGPSPSPHPGDLRRAWQGQRASSFALVGLAARLRGASEAVADRLRDQLRDRLRDQLRDRGARVGSDPQLEVRIARVRAAHELLAAAVERLAAVARANQSSGEGSGPEQIVALLDDWGLLSRAAVHGVLGPEMSAARVIVERCRRASASNRGQAPDLASLTIDLDHALAGASAGTWDHSRALSGASSDASSDASSGASSGAGTAGPSAVWIVPYGSAATLGQLPPRVFLTGLDAYPRAPVHHGPVSEAVRAQLGLVAERTRFVVELRALDELVAGASRAGAGVVGSWRHRDGSGARRPPGPWIAGRQDHDRERAVGVDGIALPVPAPDRAPEEPPEDPPDGLASAPLERTLLNWRADPLLRRRVEAVRSHEAPTVGPHTGRVGVRVGPDRPYSASALQRYATLPYQYFVERVIGLREVEEAGTGAAALLAREQGQVVHQALETAHSARLQATGGPIDLGLGAVSPELLGEVLAALAAGYERRAEHGQAEAIWASERDRWAVELKIWWQRWHERLVAAHGPTGVVDPSRSGRRARPEPEVLMPGRVLLATEWSPQKTGETGETGETGGPAPFELDLHVRTIPFIAAVDRIELDPVRQRLVVVDYKTGRPRWAGQLAAQLRAGTHLQLPLYARAVEQIVQTDPGRLGLPGPGPVGALRLEYLQRPIPRGTKLGRPEARGFAPQGPLGVDASGQVWTVLNAAMSFSVAFVEAIEAGAFPLVAREPARGRPGFGTALRFAELARFVPGPEARVTSLPPALLPLPDARANREVVR